MKRLLFLLPLVTAFIGCSETNVAGGPGSITTNGRANVDGAPAPFARVSLRNVDHMALAAHLDDAVSNDTYADDQGKFKLEIPKDGSYRLTISSDGHAFSKIVDASSKEILESVDLLPTAVMQGELDIPEGSSSVWVGVMGTDILVPADNDGVFVIPALPANDSLQLYFVDEAQDNVMETKTAFFSPTEFVYENYKEIREIPADTTVKPEVKDTVEVPVDTVKKIVVLLGDGSAAAYAGVAIRKSYYKASKFALQNSLIKADFRADGEGKFAVQWPDSGSYRVTVLAGNYSYTKVYDADSLSAIDTLKLTESSSISSKVTLNSGESFAWVGVYGMDLLVKTNAQGAYVLPAVPAGENLDLYFVHADSSESFVEWSVKTPKDGIAFLNPSKLLFDFEEDSPLWYMDVDTLYKGTTFKFANGKVDGTHLLADHLQMDESRDSKVFYTRYEIAKDPYAWTLLGSKLEELKNFVAIDSIEFYAKGSGKVRVALENWESYSKNAKAASEWMMVDSVWTRMVVKPSGLCVNSSEKWACDETWDGVKNQVRQIHFFFAAGNEISIDDVKIYGALF